MANKLTFIKNFFNKLKQFCAGPHYMFASIKNRFPCRIIGEKNIYEKRDTTIIYNILTKITPYEITVKKLLNDPLLLEKFSSQDAVKLGFIACGDIMFNLPENERLEKYREITQKMLNKEEI